MQCAKRTAKDRGTRNNGSRWAFAPSCTISVASVDVWNRVFGARGNATLAEYGVLIPPRLDALPHTLPQFIVVSGRSAELPRTQEPTASLRGHQGTSAPKLGPSQP